MDAAIIQGVILRIIWKINDISKIDYKIMEAENLHSEINIESTLDKLLSIKPEYSASNYRNPFLATAMVNLKLYGKVLDIDYSKRLLNEDLSLSEVIELDKKQKLEIKNKPVKATEKDTNDPKSGLKNVRLFMTQ